MILLHNTSQLFHFVKKQDHIIKLDKETSMDSHCTTSVCDNTTSDRLFKLILDRKWDEARRFLVSLPWNKKVQQVHYIHPDGGYTPVATAIFQNAPEDLIQLIFSIECKNQLKCCDKYGSSALHTACVFGSKEVIKDLIEASDIDDLTKLNYSKLTPLDSLLGFESQKIDEVLLMQKKIYELDPKAELFPHKSLKHLLSWVHVLSPKEQDKVFENSLLIKVFLNHTFLSRKVIAILLADIYIRLLITFVYSYLVVEVINGNRPASESLLLLIICLYWNFSRELSQIANTYLPAYITDPTNWFDIAQLLILPVSCGILASFDGNLSINERLLFMCAVVIAWVRLLFGLGVLWKGIALFAVALIRVSVPKCYQ